MFLGTSLLGSVLCCLLCAILIIMVGSVKHYNFNQASALTTQSAQGPIVVNDTKLKVEVVFKGIKFPTSMAFLGPNDILVLEKNNGTVQRIVNGVMLKKPLLDVNVASKYERGMLGIAVAPKHENNKPTYVFLYFTESKTNDSDDSGPNSKEPLGNRLYRYELASNNSKLLNPKLLLDLPAMPGPIHNGGRLKIGPEGDVYLTVGNVNNPQSKAENIKNGTAADGTAGILRITQDGKPVRQKNGNVGILGHKFPLNLYYGYGLRNSFGIDFDPVTKNLWDTENGESFGDEVNIVKPGFNSGWNKVQGIWKVEQNGRMGNTTSNPDDLLNFDGKGKYSPPELATNRTIAPTAITFISSDKLGKQYEHDLLVGSFNLGNIYLFELKEDRSGLVLKKPLDDKLAKYNSDLKNAIFAEGFGGITDIEVGPDGYLYISSLYKGAPNCDPKIPDRQGHCIYFSSPVDGTIFRIVPTSKLR
jgi:glucose/arabinose dehydrogenase